MILYNYSSLQKRDTKIYNVGGYDIAGGFSIEFLKVVGPAFLAIFGVGAVIGLLFRVNFYNPFGAHFSLPYLMVWLILGLAVSLSLWYIQFAGYRLYEYLLAYFKPKRIYMNDFANTEVQLTTIKINAIVKNIL